MVMATPLGLSSYDPAPATERLSGGPGFPKRQAVLLSLALILEESSTRTYWAQLMTAFTARSA